MWMDTPYILREWKKRKHPIIALIVIGALLGIVPLLKDQKQFEPEELPWYNLPPIGEFIQANIDPKGILKDEAIILPDENKTFHEQDTIWVPGAKDGLACFQRPKEYNTERIDHIVSLLKDISEHRHLSDKVELYWMLAEDQLVPDVDKVLDQLVDQHMYFDPYVHEFAKWLAFQSPDRGPVKFGIALLGLISDPKDVPAILAIGKHEEFTLFSAVAIDHMKEDPDEDLWQLAQQVHGWGKIQAVTRISATEDPEIKHWLLTEGYQNEIDETYLAYPCAVNGNLKEALAKEQLSSKELIAYGQLIQSLIYSDIAQSMESYEDGVAVTQSFVQHMKQGANILTHFLSLNTIKTFLENEEANWIKRESLGWTDQVKDSLINDITAIMSQDKWRKMVEKSRISISDPAYEQINQAALILGIDLWERHWKHLKKDPLRPSSWNYAAQYVNEARVEALVSLAESQLPLDKIATGPENRDGWGESYRLHQSLNYLLQILDTFPPNGLELLKVGIQSPIISNRQSVISVLQSWDKTHWATDMPLLLKKSLILEPNEPLRMEMIMLLEE